MTISKLAGYIAIIDAFNEEHRNPITNDYDILIMFESTAI